MKLKAEALQILQARLQADYGVSEEVAAALNDPNVRLYLDSWVLPALRHLQAMEEGRMSASDYKYQHCNHDMDLGRALRVLAKEEK